MGRFIQADTIVPEPGNSQAYNRYMFVVGNPLVYTDPNGHAPEWIDTLNGAVTQFAMDIIRPMYDNPLAPPVLAYLADAMVIDNMDRENAAYQSGREIGRRASNSLGGAMMIVGAAEMGAGLAAMIPTGGAGGACTLASGGACAVPTGIVLAGEAGLVVEGATIAGYGAMMLASNAKTPPKHHIATNKNTIAPPQWINDFERLFQQGNMSLNDRANIVELPGHTGPHSQGYHEWVWDRLTRATQGLSDPIEFANALRKELGGIADDLLQDINLLRQ